MVKTMLSINYLRIYLMKRRFIIGIYAQYFEQNLIEYTKYCSYH